MSTDRPLLGKLGNFLKIRQGIDAGRLREALVCPPQWARMQGFFPLFEWACTEAGPPPIFGIRRLVGPTPFRLSDFRSLGFRTESRRYSVRPPIAGGAEHYLVAELTTVETATVYFCMHVPPEGWYVLDEHRLTRENA